MSNLDNYWQSDHEAIPLETRAILHEYLLSIKLANKGEATIKKYLQSMSQKKISGLMKQEMYYG